MYTCVSMYVYVCICIVSAFFKALSLAPVHMHRHNLRDTVHLYLPLCIYTLGGDDR